MNIEHEYLKEDFPNPYVAVALWDYGSQSSSQLSVHRGDKLAIISETDAHWCLVMSSEFDVGLVPSPFLMKLPLEPPPLVPDFPSSTSHDLKVNDGLIHSIRIDDAHTMIDEARCIKIIADTAIGVEKTRVAPLNEFSLFLDDLYKYRECNKNDDFTSGERRQLVDLRKEPLGDLSNFVLERFFNGILHNPHTARFLLVWLFPTWALRLGVLLSQKSLSCDINKPINNCSLSVDQENSAIHRQNVTHRAHEASISFTKPKAKKMKIAENCISPIPQPNINEIQPDIKQFSWNSRFSTFEEAKSYLSEYSFQAGFQLRLKTSTPMRRYEFVCHRHGSPRFSVHESDLKKKRRVSLKCHCPYITVLSVFQKTWRFTKCTLDHNHELQPVAVPE